MKKTVLTVIALTALSGALISRAESGPGVIPSDEGLFPFMISYDMARGVTDYSFLLDAPAGKHGFTRIEDKHFVNDAGRIRFNGINVVGGACFPSHEQAERMARRLAHFGFNMVRLHFFDLADYNFRLIHEKGLLVDDGTWLTIDPEQQDKMDYLINQLKKRGIYIDVNLLVGRPFKPRNGFDKEIQQKEIDFTREFFTHVNPYTGLSLAEDPAVALVELNNENALMSTYMTRSEPWSAESGEPEWPTYDELKKASPEKKLEMLHTIENLDKEHWNRQKEMLVNELGVKVPITSSQMNYASPWSFSDMDYFDMHAYWCHPIKSRETYGWTIENLPMVNAREIGTLVLLSTYRPSDRPFTVSEYNNPFPNFYGAEGHPMLHAYGAFQGWDGVIAHSYHNLSDVEPDCLPYNFGFAARTDALAHFIGCASMFLRGDVSEATGGYVLHLPYDMYEKHWAATLDRTIYTPLFEASGKTARANSRLIHRSETDFFATEPKEYVREEFGPVKISDNGQIEWNREETGKGMYIVRTENTKFFTGFPAGRTIDWGDGISFEVGQTKLGWTTMTMVSKKGNGFARRATALLIATGFTKQTGQVITAEPEKGENGAGAPKLIHSRGDDWGTGPMLNEGIPATVKLASKARRTRCWALDGRGRRMKKVPVTKAEDGCAVIAIAPDYKTIWYEIKTR